MFQDLAGDHEEVLSMEEFGGYKTESKEMIEEWERLALKENVKQEKHIITYKGARSYIVLKPCTAQWPSRKAETCLLCRGLGPTTKKKNIYL